MKTVTRKLKIFIGVLVILACAITAGMYVMNTQSENTRQIAKIEQNTQHLTEQLTEVPEGYTAITTAEELQAIGADSESLAGNYILMNNIDMATSSITNFVPIGDGTNKFTGIFDGNGYVISNLNIESNKDYVGLFGYVERGTIKNVGIDGGTVSGTRTNNYAYVGGLVGSNYYGTISNSYATGAVTGTGNNSAYVGGLVGYNYGTISNSYATGEVNGIGTTNTYMYVGGLVGKSDETISNSYATGEVNGTMYDLVMISTFFDTINEE